MEIAQNLSQLEYEQIKNDPPPGVMVAPDLRAGLSEQKVAGQIIGYTGKTEQIPTALLTIMKRSGLKPRDARSSKRLTTCSKASMANTNSPLIKMVGRLPRN